MNHGGEVYNWLNCQELFGYWESCVAKPDERWLERRVKWVGGVVHWILGGKIEEFLDNRKIICSKCIVSRWYEFIRRDEFE